LDYRDHQLWFVHAQCTGCPSQFMASTIYEEGLLSRMQDIIQFFLDTLQVTGDDLTPEKCARDLICPRWENRKAQLLQPHKSHTGITPGSRATVITARVKRKAPDEGHWTLGFQMMGDGTRNATRTRRYDRESNTVWRSNHEHHRVETLECSQRCC
jgi:hypothetical protein